MEELRAVPSIRDSSDTWWLVAPGQWIAVTTLLGYSPHWLSNPVGRGEERYNRRHKTARCTIEREFGLLKVRFRCLHKTGQVNKLILLDPIFLQIVLLCTIVSQLNCLFMTLISSHAILI